MYFFDTYAFIEIIKGNSNYIKYNDETAFTTRLNLMELYYYLLRTFGTRKADYYFDYYLPMCLNIPHEIIKEAMKFRLKYKSRDLSYVDCIGYVLALQLGLKFLTGDKQFKGMKNVEYVK